MTLNGSATVLGGTAIRMTNNATYQAGSAWSNQRLPTTQDLHAQFSFYLHDSNTGTRADGIMFVIQNSSAGTGALGGTGGYLGYQASAGTAGITPSVGVEFDTYNNSAEGWDTNNNHVGIDQGGRVDQNYLAPAVSPGFQLYGEPITAWVDYIAASHSLSVYVANTGTKPAAPTISATADLTSLVGTSSAYVGFTSATGANDEIGDLTAFSVVSGAGPYISLGQLIGSACGVDAIGCPYGFVGEPVNLANGSFYTSVTDASMPNIGTPFAFVRSYNSADTTPAQSPSPGGTNEDQPIPISQGWTSSYNIYLRQADPQGDLVLHAGDGQQVVFPKQSDGTFLGGSGVRDALVKNGDGTYTVTRQDLVKYQFDANGNVISEKDRNGEGLTFSYTSGHVTSISGNGAWTVTPGYTNGQLTSLSLPLSRSVGYSYDTSGRLHVVTDLRSQTTTYDYTTTSDGGGIPNLLKTITDQRHNVVTTTVYGADGRVTQQQDARQQWQYFSWNPTTQTATYTDQRGKVWTYKFSGGTLVSVTDPLNDVTIYTYDADDNVQSMTVTGDDGTGTAALLTTNYTYFNGNLSEEDSPSQLGYAQNWTYDASNNLLSYIDGRSPRRTTLYGYDSAGNLTCETLPSQVPASSCAAAPMSSKTTFGRDPAGTGLLTSTTDPNGNTTNFTYDAMRDLKTATTPLNETTTYCYDAGGRMTARIDPRATTDTCAQPGPFTWTYGYNNANQLTSIADPLNDSNSWSYDADGNVATKTDGLGGVVRYGYDTANNLVCVEAPWGSAIVCGNAPQAAKTTYTYWPTSQLQSRTDSNSHTWNWAYDDAGRLQTITSPKNEPWSLTYWPNNLLKQKTLPSAPTIGYGYDALGRLRGLTYSNAPTTPNVTFGYDANGNRTSMSDGGGSVAYVYDDANRMTSATRGGANPFSYSYYPAGQLQTVTYPNNSMVGYEYDADERLCTATRAGTTTSCTVPLSGTVSYGYDHASDLTGKTWPNSVSSTMTYDNADRVASVVNKIGATTLSSYAINSRDGEGDPLSLTTAAGTTYYAYGYLSRLRAACNLQPTSTTCPSGTTSGQEYAYDAVGNRLTLKQYSSSGSTTTTYAYNEDDELCWAYAGTSSNTCASPPGGSTTYAFSANGNETSAGSSTYTYDSENRMISAQGGSSSTTYSYDGDGNLYSAVTGSTATNYFWDVNRPLPLLALEEDASGAVLRRYVYGTNDLIGMTNQTNVFDYLDDAYGNVANVTKASGTSEWAYTYDPFGNVTATKVDANAPANPMQFGSQYLDSVTSLYYLRARAMDPGTGRFTQQDPISLPPDKLPFVATYVYVNDRPTMLIDRSGALTEVGAGGGGDDPQGGMSMDATQGGGPGGGPGEAGFVGEDVVGCPGTAETAGRPAAASGIENDLADLVNEVTPVEIAGLESGTIFRDAPWYAEQYGGDPADYVKYVSAEWITAPNGETFQIHWVENVATGQIYDAKAVWAGTR